METNFDKLANAAFVLKTIAHPTRLAVLHLLYKQGRLNVNTIVEITGCEQSLLSHHLSHMREVGLLKTEREGQHIFYSLCEKEFSHVLNSIESYSQFVDEKGLVKRSNEVPAEKAKVRTQ